MKRAIAILLIFGLGGLFACAALRERHDGRELAPSVPGRFIDVGGHRVHIVEQGTGTPLLLIHGFGASTHDYEEFVLAPLARAHRAIAVDLFGFGWSERSDAFDYSWPLWADQLAGTLDALGIPRASVVGHSMGGAVAAVFAARHPERVDRLILADAMYPQLPSETPLMFKALRTPGLGELMLGVARDPSAPGFSSAYRERARTWYRIRGTRSAFLRYIRAPSKRAELAAAYPRIDARTLVLHGTADDFSRFASMERATPAIRNVRVVLLPEGGHFLLRDSPERFIREVDAFLREP